MLTGRGAEWGRNNGPKERSTKAARTDVGGRTGRTSVTVVHPRDKLQMVA